MTDLDEYRKNPCGTLSIPYFKVRRMQIPKGMQIINGRDYDRERFRGFEDEAFFRLFHDLKDLTPNENEEFFIRTVGEEDVPLVGEIIRRSYEDVSISNAELLAMRSEPEFLSELWVLVFERESGLPAACGIGAFDKETGEGTLEWIQTLPGFRRRGAGTLIVAELLLRLSRCAEFATVSGKANDPSEPEKLYRKCGFTGTDVWHVLRKRGK